MNSDCGVDSAGGEAMCRVSHRKAPGEEDSTCRFPAFWAGKVGVLAPNRSTQKRRAHAHMSARSLLLPCRVWQARGG